MQGGSAYRNSCAFEVNEKTAWVMKEIHQSDSLFCATGSYTGSIIRICEKIQMIARDQAADSNRGITQTQAGELPMQSCSLLIIQFPVQCLTQRIRIGLVRNVAAGDQEILDQLEALEAQFLAGKIRVLHQELFVELFCGIIL